MPKPEMTMFHVRSAQIGYGRLGVYLAKEIEKQGITVYDEIAKAPHSYVLDNPRAYESFGPKPEGGLSNIVTWVSTPSHARGWWEGQTPILFTMFETTHLPTSFRENLHEFDTIVVPSKQNYDLFSRYHDNVRYVPLGVDTERWQFVERTMPTTRFNFMVAGRGQRKGTDLAYAAFRKCFPEGSWGDGPVPYLTMKAPRPEDGFYGERVEAVTGYLSAEDERALYANTHCYLGPSRGEGFGLQPLQAIVQGCPTILTNAHGHEAFAHLGMGLDYKLEKAGYFVYGDSGDWWEPNFDELCDTMLWTYHNYQEAVDRARINAKLAAEEFTWKRTTDMFLDAVGRERLTALPKMPIKWHEPVGRLYKVVLIKHHTADIGGTIMAFEPGVEYRLPADVKRILFDAGLVDVARSGTPIFGDATTYGHPVWDAGDEGLLPHQVEKMPELMKRQAYCPTCHQKYGTGESLTDAILEELDTEVCETVAP